MAPAKARWAAEAQFREEFAKDPRYLEAQSAMERARAESKAASAEFDRLLADGSSSGNAFSDAARSTVPRNSWDPAPVKSPEELAALEERAAKMRAV